MSFNAELSIKSQYDKYFKNNKEPNQGFIVLYNGFPNELLQKLFSTIHADSNYLLERMNDRLPTKGESRHYPADYSRELLSLIEVVHTLQKELKNSEMAFQLNGHYAGLFNDCEQWLQRSNGSSIPAHMDKINIYYGKPLFIQDRVMPNAELHALGEKAELLGMGGFGEVYKYRHPLIELDFAVKFLNPSFLTGEARATSEKRFFREAKMLFQLNHPNIVRIYDVGIYNGKPFIKMELINGMTLDKIQQKYNQLPFLNAGRAIIQILSGLQHAHNQRIIHRDLKPSNIMADTRLNEWMFKIIDFGVSAFMDVDGHTKITKTGNHVAGGKFIAPELSETPELRDIRSDIYSVGAILYFLLCGQAPTVEAEKHLRKSNDKLTDKQIALVMKALSTDIASRYSSCDEMRETMEEELKNMCK